MPDRSIPLSGRKNKMENEIKKATQEAEQNGLSNQEIAEQKG